MRDKPDLIDEAAGISRNWGNADWTPEEAVQQFHLYAPDYRASLLDDYDKELRTADTSNLRRYSDLHALRSQLDQVHHRLRKAGR